MTGLVCDIQRFSIQDGPGIRTTVFLQGCTLRCAWCHNPESIPPRPVARRAKGGCAKAPDHDAVTMSSREMSAQEVIRTVLEDMPFYRKSGGGLTLSGGEPLFQRAFALELLGLAKQQGLDTALETAGHVPGEALLAALPLTNLFLYDFKLDRDAESWIGADGQLIRSNLAMLHSHGARIILRCPIIHGVNNDAGHLEAIAGLLRGCPGIMGVELLAYHRLGIGKYREIGQEYRLARTRPMDEAEKAAFLSRAEKMIGHPVKWG